MKKTTYRYIPFVITLPSLAMIWLTSADTNPAWLKHLVFGTSFLLISLVFLFFSLAKVSQKNSTKAEVKKTQTHYSFVPFIVLGLTIPSIVINILSAELSDLAKVLVLTITPTLASLIFGLTTLIHHRKQNQHEI